MLRTTDSVSNKRMKNFCLQEAYVLGRETENKHIQKVGTGLLYDSSSMKCKNFILIIEINQWWEVEVRGYSVWSGDDHSSESALVKCCYRVS